MEEARSPLRARQIAKTRRLVRNALSANMSPTATFFADKLVRAGGGPARALRCSHSLSLRLSLRLARQVTLSGHEPEDVLLLARAYYSSGDYLRGRLRAMNADAFGYIW